MSGNHSAPPCRGPRRSLGHQSQGFGGIFSYRMPARKGSEGVCGGGVPLQCHGHRWLQQSPVCELLLEARRALSQDRHLAGQVGAWLYRSVSRAAQRAWAVIDRRGVIRFLKHCCPGSQSPLRLPRKMATAPSILYVARQGQVTARRPVWLSQPYLVVLIELHKSLYFHLFVVQRHAQPWTERLYQSRVQMRIDANPVLGICTYGIEVDIRSACPSGVPRPQSLVNMGVRPLCEHSA